MQRVTRSTAVAVQPAPPASPGPPGFFTGGNPGGGLPATVPGYEWFNGVQEELIGVLTRAGLTPSAADVTQLRQALDRLTGGGLRAVAANVTLTADDAGLVLVDAAGGSRTVTLPAANACAGRPIMLRLVRVDSTGANSVTIQRAGSDTIDGAASITLALGERLTLVSDGSSAWRIIGGRHTQSLAAAGWVRLPNGLIMQWARVSIPGVGGANWTYPIAFPAAVYGVFGTAVTTGALPAEAVVVTPNPSLTAANVDFLSGGIVCDAFVWSLGS